MYAGAIAASGLTAGSPTGNLRPDGTDDGTVKCDSTATASYDPVGSTALYETNDCEEVGGGTVRAIVHRQLLFDERIARKPPFQLLSTPAENSDPVEKAHMQSEFTRGGAIAASGPTVQSPTGNLRHADIMEEEASTSHPVKTNGPHRFDIYDPGEFQWMHIWEFGGRVG